MYISLFELTLLVSQHSTSLPCSHQSGTKEFWLRLLNRLAPTDGSRQCVWVLSTLSILCPLNLLSLSLFFLLSLFLTNSSPVYITILVQLPGTHPKLYKMNKYPIISKLYKINFFRIFSFFFYLVLRLNCMYIVIGKKLRDLKRQC